MVGIYFGASDVSTAKTRVTEFPSKKPWCHRQTKTMVDRWTVDKVVTECLTASSAADSVDF